MLQSFFFGNRSVLFLLVFLSMISVSRSPPLLIVESSTTTMADITSKQQEKKVTNWTASTSIPSRLNSSMESIQKEVFEMVTNSSQNSSIAGDTVCNSTSTSQTKFTVAMDRVSNSTPTPQVQPIPTVKHEVRHRSRKKKKDRNRKKHRGGNATGACRERTEMDLQEMLGPAFNGRYMAVERPMEEDGVIIEDSASPADGEMADDSGKIATRPLPFHVDWDFSRELPPDFYLDISWYQEVIHSLSDSAAKLLRFVRSAAVDVGKAAKGQDGVEALSQQDLLPWQCTSKIIWTDLGANYYPRFLRNVQCTRKKCWFAHFECRPKAFTVNVLKRIKDSCKDKSNGDDWVYEERAVTFCCECSEY